MNEVTDVPGNLETDPRFPSGRWFGFWVQKHPPIGRHSMELLLKFETGQVSGEGRDWVGPFLIRGRYDLSDGRCHWTKRYLGKHDVFYQGFNEGKGIWGTWEIPTGVSGWKWGGGFRVWPEGMADPYQPVLREEADLPLEVDETPVLEPVPMRV